MTSRALRRALVADLERLGAVRSATVRKAFLAVPRELFLPEVAAREGLARVYANEVHVTKRDARGWPISSSSQPTIMAEMLERLDVRPGHRVLEIGAGAGYNAALLSTLVGPNGSVTSVEIDHDLATRAAAALRGGGYPVRVVVADGELGLHGERPFDRIILTASADRVAPPWFEQLAPSGLIELPLRSLGDAPWDMVVVTFRKEPDHLRSVGVVLGGFMPLRGVGGGAVSAGAPPSVHVADVIEGKRHLHADLVGPGLASMTASARRRLAALALSAPRVLTLRLDGPAHSTVLPFVAMSRPPRGLVLVRHWREEFHGRHWWGFGLASRDGRSLAVATGGREPLCRVERYGDGPAVTGLDSVLNQWKGAGRPSTDDLVVRAWTDGRITVTWSGGYPVRPPGMGAGARPGRAVARRRAGGRAVPRS